MYCPNCGTLNLERAESCINCKILLPRPEATPNESAPPPNYAPPRRDYYPGQPGSQYSYNPGANYNQPGYYAPPPTAGYPSAAYAPVYGYSNSADRIGVAQHDAGFLVRLGAWLIDSIIVGLITAIVVGIPQLIYWSGFVAKYGTEIANSCPSGNSYTYSARQICNNTVESIFLGHNELGSILSISIGFSFVALVLSLIYYVGLTAYGATLGKKVFGLKVVGPDGMPPGFGRALLRMTIGYWISGLVFYLGFIWIALDEHKQGWHDKIAQTYVVRA
jgi:uncharacterized RDD family membrane protein YckC